jgi:hypothetical protein
MMRSSQPDVSWTLLTRRGFDATSINDRENCSLVPLEIFALRTRFALRELDPPRSLRRKCFGASRASLSRAANSSAARALSPIFLYGIAARAARRLVIVRAPRTRREHGRLAASSRARA